MWLRTLWKLIFIIQLTMIIEHVKSEDIAAQPDPGNMVANDNPVALGASVQSAPLTPNPMHEQMPTKTDIDFNLQAAGTVPPQPIVGGYKTSLQRAAGGGDGVVLGNGAGHAVPGASMDGGLAVTAGGTGGESDVATVPAVAQGVASMQAVADLQPPVMMPDTITPHNTTPVGASATPPVGPNSKTYSPPSLNSYGPNGSPNPQNADNAPPGVMYAGANPAGGLADPANVPPPATLDANGKPSVPVVSNPAAPNIAYAPAGAPPVIINPATGLAEPVKPAPPPSAGTPLQTALGPVYPNSLNPQGYPQFGPQPPYGYSFAFGRYPYGNPFAPPPRAPVPPNPYSPYPYPNTGTYPYPNFYARPNVTTITLRRSRTEVAPWPLPVGYANGVLVNGVIVPNPVPAGAVAATTIATDAAEAPAQPPPPNAPPSPPPPSPLNASPSVVYPRPYVPPYTYFRQPTFVQ